MTWFCRGTYLSTKHLTAEAREELFNPERAVLFHSPIALMTNRCLLWVDVEEVNNLELDTGYESFDDCMEWAVDNGMRFVVFSDDGEVVEDLTLYED